MLQKFSMTEVSALCSELRAGALDALQAAEVLQMFVTRHGYGVSPESARAAIDRIIAGASEDAVRSELDNLALVM